MDSYYGISNSDVHKRSSLSPVHSYASQNPYYHHTLPMVDPYASPDGHTTVLKNLNSPYLRYVHSARSLAASPNSAGDHLPSYGYSYHRSSESSSRMEPPPRRSRSPVIFSNSPAKVVEDVLVMDGVLVKKQSADKSRSSSSSSSLADSGGSSSSVGKNYKTDLCLSYLENSGYCRYGSKCQFAHGNKELRSSTVPYKSMPEIPCQSYSVSGTCSYGSKCRFLHSETSTSTSPKVATSAVKQDEVTSNIVKQKTTNWYPLDDDIEIQTTGGNIASNEEFDAYLNNLLYGPRKNKRLPVFSQICQE